MDETLVANIRLIRHSAATVKSGTRSPPEEKSPRQKTSKMRRKRRQKTSKIRTPRRRTRSNAKNREEFRGNRVIQSISGCHNGARGSSYLSGHIKRKILKMALLLSYWMISSSKKSCSPVNFFELSEESRYSTFQGNWYLIAWIHYQSTISTEKREATNNCYERISLTDGCARVQWWVWSSKTPLRC